MTFQRDLGCEAIILPSPLTREHSTDYSREVEWLEAGLAVCRLVAPGLPHIATVAVSDTCLRGINPSANSLIDLILDQVSARQPDGVYIVLELANETRYYCGSPDTIGALLRFVSGFRAGGHTRVIVGFGGLAGFLALTAGADTWTSGWYRGERRLRLSDFEQDEGRAMPTYYSHPLATDVHLRGDLDRLVASGYLPQVADRTVSSEGLLAALSAGRRVDEVTEWRYRQSNVTAARAHYLAASIRETAIISELSESACLDHARHWLDGAVTLARRLYRLGDFHDRTELDHQRAWHDAMNALVPA